MIFVTVGSQKFQFNRLLKEVDKLIEEGAITEEVYAQTGYSDYKPKNYDFKEFLDRDEFAEVMKKCDKVITHGGTGAIIGAVKKGKKVIAVPRLKEFEEHVDNHQKQLLEQFNDLRLIIACYDENEIINAYYEINKFKCINYKSNTITIIKNLDEFIEGV